MGAAPDLNKAEKKHPSFEKYKPYHLNWENFGSYECKFGPKPTEGKPILQPIKFSDLIGKLMEKNVTDYDRSPFYSTVTIDGAKHAIECKGICQDLLFVFLHLIKEKKMGECTWYFYDTDHVRDDFHESFSFFLTKGKEIVLDRAPIHHSGGSWLDSDFLKYYGDHVWRGEDEIEKASAIWWYQKFYNESDWGQIIKIRDTMDATDGKAANEKSVEVLALGHLIREIKKSNTLLVFILIALALMFFFHRQ